MTAYQSLFTELLPDKRKAAKGAAVEKGSGKDWNEKKNVLRVSAGRNEGQQIVRRKGKCSSKSARERTRVCDEGSKD